MAETVTTPRRVLLWVRPEVKQQLKICAATEGCTMGELIARWVAQAQRRAQEERYPMLIVGLMLAATLAIVLLIALTLPEG